MSNGIVTCRTMGCGGRFGNQLFAYAFAKGYARRHGLELRVPSTWVGRYIFEIPEVASDDIVYRHTPLDTIPGGESEIDLYGYYQYQQAANFYSIRDLAEWFRLKPRWMDLLHTYMEREDPAEVVCHIRAGDYLDLTSHFCYVTPISYWDAIKEYGYSQHPVRWMSEYNASREPNVPDSIGFLPDFLQLVNTNYLFRSNSTFSWWAATLRTAWVQGHTQYVYAPLVKGKFGPNRCKFIRGNHPQMASRDQHTLSDLYVE